MAIYQLTLENVEFRMATLTAIDLFAGAGGFSEGLAQVGIKTLLAQELHPQPALTHVFNHPGAIGVVGDIRKLDADLLRNLLHKHHNTDKVDLIVGGPPCQGFSTAGKKNENDPRNTLFDNYCDIVSAFKPKAVVLENVPGFKKMYEGKMYLAAKARFEEMGYTVKDTILNAVDFGVPQRRKRFVLVAVRADLQLDFEWPQPTHLNPESGSLDLFTSSLLPHTSVEEALSDLEFIQPGEEAFFNKSETQSQYQRERKNTQLLFNHLASKHRAKALQMFSLIPEGGTINSVPLAEKSSKKTMARLSRTHISNTVLALPDDLIHYTHHRIPTVREMARLQSFDDDYVFLGKRTSGFIDRKHDVPQYTQVGNAVPPLLGKAIGRQLAKMLGADIIDSRDLEKRSERLKYVRGSSGFSGYTLSSRIADELYLYDITGNRLDLPIDESNIPVFERTKISNWTASRSESPKRQWAPGVSRPSLEKSTS